MQFIGIARLGTLLVADACDGLGVERTKISSGRRTGRAPRLHRVTSPLLERRIVQKRVGPGVEDVVGEQRGLRRVARDEAQFAGVDPLEHQPETFEVHRFFEAVAHRLGNERMIGNLAVAGDVLQARGRVGEHGGHQVVGQHALKRWRDPARSARARHRQRDRRVPPPARLEHGRVEERLHEDVFGRLGVEVAKDVRERERVLRTERQHQRIFGRRRLQLEVELAAEALAQREAPRLIDAAAKWRVQHELHATGFVEEPLEDERLL